MNLTRASLSSLRVSVLRVPVPGCAAGAEPPPVTEESVAGVVLLLPDDVPAVCANACGQGKRKHKGACAHGRCFHP